MSSLISPLFLQVAARFKGAAPVQKNSVHNPENQSRPLSYASLLTGSQDTLHIQARSPIQKSSHATQPAFMYGIGTTNNNPPAYTSESAITALGYRKLKPKQARLYPNFSTLRGGAPLGVVYIQEDVLKKVLLIPSGDTKGVWEMVDENPSLSESIQAFRASHEQNYTRTENPDISTFIAENSSFFNDLETLEIMGTRLHFVDNPNRLVVNPKTTAPETIKNYLLGNGFKALSDKTLKTLPLLGSDHSPLAVIDVGSQTAKLVIVIPHGDSKGVYKLSLPIKLGESIGKTRSVQFNRSGHLTDDVVTDLINKLTLFSGYLEALKIQRSRIHAVATAGLRQPENGEEALRRVIDAVPDIKPAIIEQDEEAQLELLSISQELHSIFEKNYKGQESGRPLYLYLGIGGGSTQLTPAQHLEAEEGEYALDCEKPVNLSFGADSLFGDIADELSKNNYDSATQTIADELAKNSASNMATDAPRLLFVPEKPEYELLAEGLKKIYGPKAEITLENLDKLYANNFVQLEKYFQAAEQSASSEEKAGVQTEIRKLKRKLPIVHQLMKHINFKGSVQLVKSEGVKAGMIWKRAQQDPRHLDMSYMNLFGNSNGDGSNASQTED